MTTTKLQMPARLWFVGALAVLAMGCARTQGPDPLVARDANGLPLESRGSVGAAVPSAPGGPNVAGTDALLAAFGPRVFPRTPVPAIMGRVDWPQIAPRKAQASIGEVVSFATLSFIDASANQTVASTVSNAAGGFSLSLGGWLPGINVPYVVEAYKGLGAHIPGREAMRYRTIVKWTGSFWQAVSTPSIVISNLTTAVAIEAGLDPIGMDPATTMDKVNTAASPPALNATPAFTGHPDAEILKLALDIAGYLVGDVDPVRSVPKILPELTAISTDSGKAGDVLSLTGNGFSPLIGGNTVTIGTVTAAINVATPTRLVVIMPTDAVVGANSVKVTTNRGASLTLGYEVKPIAPPLNLRFASPTSGTPGTEIILLGFGLSKVAAENTVSFGGVNTSCATADTDFCKVNVPAAAIAGPVSITTPKGTTNALAFTVIVSPTITSYFPSSGAPPQEIEIDGSNFSSSGSVKIAGVDAPINSWSPTRVIARVPTGTVTGNLTVAQAGGSSTTAGVFTVLGGNIASWAALANTVPAGNTNYGWSARYKKWLYFGGGYNGTYKDVVQRALINSDGTLGPWVQLAGVSQKFSQQTYNSYDLEHQAQVLGDYAYVYGGSNYVEGIGTCCANSTVMRAQFFSDGSMSNFAVAPVSLSKGIYGLAGLLRIKNYVYVLGGHGNTTYSTSDTIQAAQINADGTLQPFANVGLLPISSYASNFIHVGRYLYLFGGVVAGVHTTSYYRTTVNSDGSLGATWTNLGAMPTTTYMAQAFVLGNYVYNTSGYNTVDSWNNKIHRALINADDTLGPWTAIASAATFHVYHNLALIGARLYLFGGYNGTAYVDTYDVGTLN